jgi:hypothetical protein
MATTAKMVTGLNEFDTQCEQDAARLLYQPRLDRGWVVGWAYIVVDRQWSTFKHYIEHMN